MELVETDLNLSGYYNVISNKNNKEYIILDSKLKLMLRHFKFYHLPKYNCIWYKDAINTVKYLVKNNYVIFTDIKNAFPSVDRMKLYDILKASNINATDYIKSYYDNILIVEKNDKYFKIKNGLIKGCPLSNILFNIYIMHALKNISNIILFVDDIVIWDDKYENIINTFNIMKSELNKINLNINIHKTNFVYKKPHKEFYPKNVIYLKSSISLID
jgi:hypothetical protein